MCTRTQCTGSQASTLASRILTRVNVIFVQVQNVMNGPVIKHMCMHVSGGCKPFYACVKWVSGGCLPFLSGGCLVGAFHSSLVGAFHACVIGCMPSISPRHLLWIYTCMFGCSDFRVPISGRRTQNARCVDIYALTLLAKL